MSATRAPRATGARFAVAMRRIGARWQRFMRPLLEATFVRFVLVGGSGVFVNSAALLLFYQVAGLPLVVASVLAVELAVINGYVWNDRWTFGRRRPSFSRFMRFHLVSLGGLALTTGMLWALVRFAGVYYLAANGVGIGFATLWNFQANRLWTWKAGGRIPRA